MFNDLGVYGVPRLVRERKPWDAVTAMRKMEDFTRSVGGYHFLYADTFLSREEFEEMFDLTAYEVVRKKYHAEGCQYILKYQSILLTSGAFPHLYDKTKPEIDVVSVGKAYINPLS